MEPGIELDLLIIEEIMGWRVFRHDSGSVVIIQEDDDGVSAWQVDRDDIKRACGPRLWWSPSINSRDAMELVEHLRKRGVFITLSAEHAGYTASLHSGDDEKVILAATAPLAISLAAAAILGV